MATTLYPVTAGTVTTALAYNRSNNDTNLAGVAKGWHTVPLQTSRGSSVTAVTSSTTPVGTAGGESLDANSIPYEYVSPPISGNVTISGTITFNVRIAESSMSANIGAMVVVDRITPTGTIASTIVSSAVGVEAGLTEAASNWTATPTSTSMTVGDRLRVRLVAKNVGTVGTGFTFTIWDGGTAGATGDTFVTFTETITFHETDPTGDQMFLTNSSPGIDPSSFVDLALSTTRGSGVVSSSTNTSGSTGWSTVQAVSNGAGNGWYWYTPSLSAMTLSGPILINQRTSESSSSAHAAVRCVVDVMTGANGTGPNTTYGSNATYLEEQTTESASQYYVVGPDISISSGNRIRFGFWIVSSNTNPIQSAFTVGFAFNGTSAGASGDAFVTMPYGGSGGGGQDPFPYSTGGGYYGAFSSYRDRAKKLWGGWSKRDSGILVPRT